MFYPLGAIQSQLSPGQGQNLLGQLGQIGLLRALNPLGLPIAGLNPFMSSNRQQNDPLIQNGLGRNQANNNFGLPQTQQVPNG